MIYYCSASFVKYSVAVGGTTFEQNNGLERKVDNPCSTLLSDKRRSEVHLCKLNTTDRAEVIEQSLVASDVSS